MNAITIDKTRIDKVRAALYVLAAIMLAVGLWGFWQARAETTSPSRSNLAMTNASLTAEVQSSVSHGLGRVLSYDYAEPDATSAAADEVLAGDARDQYDTLFRQLEKKAPGQKLVLQAQVKGVAVKELTEDAASAVVFLDQTSQRASDKESSTSAAQLAVELDRNGGTWQITDLQPL